MNQPDAGLLIEAYCKGVFPMADLDSEEIRWYSPDPRGVIPLETFHTPRSLARVVRSGRFEIRTDTCFEHVMELCSEPRQDDTGTWIDRRLIDAYTELNAAGCAHSIEAWFDGNLVGGLYGVHLRGAFFGESMFSRVELGGTNASKVALVHLVGYLREAGFLLLDAQFQNPHLTQFGCVEIPREDYLDRLHAALQVETRWPQPGAFQHSASDA